MSVQPFILPPGGYKLIYADPPWDFRNRKTGGSMKSGASQKYPTMSVEEISALPIAEIAADDAVLVCWWIASMPDECLSVIRAWDFNLKTMTGFVWVKTTVRGKPFFGMGNWTRAGAECALIATRGRPMRNSGSVRSVRVARVGEHSSKPTAFRSDIMELVGNVPRIELFARTRAHGWDAWGNEI